MNALLQDMNPKTHNTLRQLAFGQATGLMVLFQEDENNAFALRQGWYDGYRYLYDCVMNNVEPSDEVVMKSEDRDNLGWSELMLVIYHTALSIELQLKEGLRLAFKGLVNQKSFLGLIQENTANTVSLENIDTTTLVTIGRHVELSSASAEAAS